MTKHNEDKHAEMLKRLDGVEDVVGRIERLLGIESPESVSKRSLDCL